MTALKSPQCFRTLFISSYQILEQLKRYCDVFYSRNVVPKSAGTIHLNDNTNNFFICRLKQETESERDFIEREVEVCLPTKLEEKITSKEQVKIRECIAPW